jgi:hemoglobin-like flavoprotein
MPITPAAFPTTHLVDATRTASGAPRAVSAEQARLVAQSWSVATGRADVFAASFYAHLLALEPSFRLTILGETSEQARERGRRLVHALDVAVTNLHRFEAASADAWGAQPWDAVGAALFAALDQVLGLAFTPPLRDAWLAAYRAIAGAMRGSASNGAPGMAA